MLCYVIVWFGPLQEARRREEQEYVRHPVAADRGISSGMQYLRERGMIGRGMVRPHSTISDVDIIYMY